MVDLNLTEGIIGIVMGIIMFIALHAGPLQNLITRDNWWMWFLGALIIFINKNRISNTLKLGS